MDSFEECGQVRKVAQVLKIQYRWVFQVIGVKEVKEADTWVETFTAAAQPMHPWVEDPCSLTPWHGVMITSISQC